MNLEHFHGPELEISDAERDGGGQKWNEREAGISIYPVRIFHDLKL